MFEQHYIENNKPTFLACNPEQVHAVIFESSKNNEFFSEPPNLHLDSQSIKILRKFYLSYPAFLLMVIM